MTMQYIHIWTNYDDDTVNTAEGEPTVTLADAIDSYWQQWNAPFEYKHTLALDHADGTFMVIDIRESMEKESDVPDYERVTGHEMGILHGRV